MASMEQPFDPAKTSGDTKTGTSTITSNLNDTNSLFGKPHNVILFNDSHNSFEDVVMQVIKATKCTPEQAYNYTLEAHEKGETSVFTGSRERCEHVESILAGPPTKLATDIRPA